MLKTVIIALATFIFSVSIAAAAVFEEVLAAP